MVKIIGIIGAGTMGSGIASVSALKGFRTIVYDINEEMLGKGRESVTKIFDRLVKKEAMSGMEKENAVSRLEFTTEFDVLSNCDFIIEAAAENLDIKKDIFARLELVAGSDSVLATNTSSLSVTAISQSVKRNNSRVVGMHFFNPANIMKLVEIVRGEFTSDETVEDAVELSKQLGKTPVICRDTPAFIVNRIARPFYGEALRILGEGKLQVSSIDRVMRDEGGFKMGPFELMDLIGIDVNYSVTKSVYEALNHNPKYKPHAIHQEMVEQGMLGKKTGKGFYDYTN